METSNSNLDNTIVEVGEPPITLVVPSANNVDYLAARDEYVLTPISQQYLNELLSNHEFLPNNWVQWYNTVIAVLNDSYNLGNIIADDISKRECHPIQFCTESEADFQSRCRIFLKRKNKVFLI